MKPNLMNTHVLKGIETTSIALSQTFPFIVRCGFSLL